MNENEDHRERLSQRTPAAERKLRKAHAQVHRLAQDGDACYAHFAPLLLVVVAPEKRETARAHLRAICDDAQEREQLLAWAFQGTLDLYDEGVFDNNNDDEDAS